MERKISPVTDPMCPQCQCREHRPLLRVTIVKPEWMCASCLEMECLSAFASVIAVDGIMLPADYDPEVAGCHLGCNSSADVHRVECGDLHGDAVRLNDSPIGYR